MKQRLNTWLLGLLFSLPLFLYSQALPTVYAFYPVNNYWGCEGYTTQYIGIYSIGNGETHSVSTTSLIGTINVTNVTDVYTSNSTNFRKVMIEVTWDCVVPPPNYPLGAAGYIYFNVSYPGSMTVSKKQPAKVLDESHALCGSSPCP